MKKCQNCEGRGWVTYQKDVPCGFCMAQELDIKDCPDCSNKKVFDPEIHCYDCGDALKWKWGNITECPGHLCRKCAEKSGLKSYVKIDPDKLEEMFEFDEAEKIIKHCQCN